MIDGCRILCKSRRVAAAILILCGIRTAAGAIQRGASTAPLLLDASTTILIGADEPPALLEAARDLASDFEKVLGQKPRLVQQPADTGAATVVIGVRSRLLDGLRSASAAAAESFTMSAREARWPGVPRRRVVLLTGGDMRGAMYSVYQFAEQFLGVDPLYYWTDHVPAQKPRIELPSSLN